MNWAINYVYHRPDDAVSTHWRFKDYSGRAVFDFEALATDIEDKRDEWVTWDALGIPLLMCTEELGETLFNLCLMKEAAT